MAATFVGAITTGSTSGTVPTHIAGDLIIVIAWRNATTAPTLASGYTSVGTSSGNAQAYRVGTLVATGTGDTSGTWTNATSVTVIVYRGVTVVGTVGGTTGASSTTATLPAITLANPSGKSVVMGAIISKQITSQSTPTGMTQEFTNTGGSAMSTVWDINGTGTFASHNSTLGTAAVYSAIVLELQVNDSIGTFADQFAGTVVDSTKWAQFTAGSATMTYASTGAQTNYPASSTSSTDGDISSLYLYDLTGSAVYLRVLNIPSSSTAADATFSVRTTDFTNILTMQVESGVLYAEYVVASVQTNAASITWNSSTMAWWQIRESGGTTYWEYSATGTSGSWTALYSHTNPIAVNNLQVDIGGACYKAETSPGIFKWNNFNYPAITNYPVASAMSGSGSMSPAILDTEAAATGMAGSGSMVAAITETEPMASGMTGAGSMTAVMTDAELDGAAMSGAGTMTGLLVDTTTIAASMSGSGSMIAGPALQQNAAANMGGAGSMGTVAISDKEIVAAAMGGASIMGQTNMLTNPSIESALTSDWTSINAAVLTQVTTAPLFGSNCLQVIATSSFASGARYSSGGAGNPATFVGQVPYTASAYVKAYSGGDVGKTISLLLIDANGGYETAVDVVLTSSWQRVTNTHTVSAAGVGGGFLIDVRENTSIATSYYVDGVQLELGSTASPYTEGGPAVPLADTEPVAVGMSGSGTMGAATSDKESLAAGLSGSSSGTAAITNATTLASAISGSGSMSPTLVDKTTIASNMGGSGTMTANPNDVEPLQAAISGAGSMNASISDKDPMAAAMSGSGTLSAGIKDATTVASGMSGSGTLTAGMVDTTTVGSAMTGSASMSPTIADKEYLAAGLGGSGTMGATTADSTTLGTGMSGSATMATVPVADKELIGSTLSGTSSATATVANKTTVGAAISGAGTMAAAPYAITYIASGMNGWGDMAVAITAANPNAFRDHRGNVNLQQKPITVNLDMERRAVALAGDSRTAYVKQI